MARQKSKPPRADGRYEIKRVIKGVYTDEGKPLRKSFYSYVSKADCERQYQDYLAEIRANSLLGLDGNIRKDVTVAEWARKWLRIYKKGNVRESSYISGCEFPVEHFIIPAFGGFPLSAIKPMMLQEQFSKWCDEYSESVVKKIKACFNAIYETAIDNDYAVKNPCKNINLQFESSDGGGKRTYSQERRDDIVKFCESHPDGLYIRLLIENGLRLSEMCGLKWSDFDLDKRTVSIQRAITDNRGRAVIGEPKSTTSKRVIPITEAMCDIIKKCMTDDVYIISVRNGGLMNPRVFRDYRYKYFFNDYIETLSEKERETFEVLSPHELRHTCGTLLYANYKDLFSVSKFLGHSSVDITAKVYVHETPDMLRENLGF